MISKYYTVLEASEMSLSYQEGAAEQHSVMRKVPFRGVSIFMVVVQGGRGHWVVTTC